MSSSLCSRIGSSLVGFGAGYGIGHWAADYFPDKVRSIGIATITSLGFLCGVLNKASTLRRTYSKPCCQLTLQVGLCALSAMLIFSGSYFLFKQGSDCFFNNRSCIRICSESECIPKALHGAAHKITGVTGLLLSPLFLAMFVLRFQKASSDLSRAQRENQIAGTRLVKEYIEWEKLNPNWLD